MKFICFRSFSLAAALGAGLFFAGHASADPVIVNGSFEAPAYAPGTVTRGGGTGWTPSFMGAVAIISGNIQDLNGRSYGVTPFGLQYLGLDPRTRGFISRDSQTIPGFVAGQTYALTLDVADSDGGQAPALNILFSNGGSVNYSDQTYAVPVGGPYGDVIAFTQVTTLFTSPVSGSITLSLTNAGTGTDPGSISIDNVAITAVPEPTTLAVTLLGGGALAGMLVRRRARVGLTA